MRLCFPNFRGHPPPSNPTGATWRYYYLFYVTWKKVLWWPRQDLYLNDDKISSPHKFSQISSVKLASIAQAKLITHSVSSKKGTLSRSPLSFSTSNSTSQASVKIEEGPDHICIGAVGEKGGVDKGWREVGKFDFLNSPRASCLC